MSLYMFVNTPIWNKIADKIQSQANYQPERVLYLQIISAFHNASSSRSAARKWLTHFKQLVCKTSENNGISLNGLEFYQSGGD